MRGDDFFTAAGLDQFGQSHVVFVGLVFDKGQIRGSGCQQNVDEYKRRSGHTEPADHDGHAVLKSRADVFNQTGFIDHLM